VPILRNDTPDTLSMAHWGFIPFFTKANAKKGFAPINARRETVATSGMFRSAFQAKRCLIPADGFIEWQTVDGKKLPHWFRMHDDSLFFFAGLWPAGSLRRTHRYWRAAPSSQARLIRWCVQFTTVCP
jgi:putative SOS response-associated peptidase YedK